MPAETLERFADGHEDLSILLDGDAEELLHHDGVFRSALHGDDEHGRDRQVLGVRI